jgi:hypothetical protein
MYFCCSTTTTFWTLGNHPGYSIDGRYFGDWVYIKLPVKIKVSKIQFTSLASEIYQGPGRFKLYGSNDGISWTEIHEQIATGYWDTVATIYVSAWKTAYQYVGLVVNSLIGPNAATLKFAEWKVFGSSVCLTVRLFKHVSVSR